MQSPQLCHVGHLFVHQQFFMIESRIETIVEIAQSCGKLLRPLTLCLGRS